MIMKVDRVCEIRDRDLGNYYKIMIGDTCFKSFQSTNIVTIYSKDRVAIDTFKTPLHIYDINYLELMVEGYYDRNN